MVEFLFIDLDDTILDFKKAEHIAVKKTLADFGVEPTDAVCARYSVINQQHWEAMERKEMIRPQVLVGRFAVLFGELGVAVDAEECAKHYTENLSVGHYFLPGAREAVERLSQKYKLYLTSNGTAWVQRSRLQSADIEKYFRDIFISQEIGFNKPAIEYFEGCFARIPGFDPDKAMIVGDSLSSDIKGGKNAQIATCWVNPGHKPAGEIQPDYQIDSLSQLEALLETL
ncbi:MAG: YjjG family noncanonical pyrimidine nucleotidase [Oscillospiraceae bacterium]|nr:YjjG family noncanonical pyrimidine nucleotidase [Oscillospiraceae bacterium]